MVSAKRENEARPKDWLTRQCLSHKDAFEQGPESGDEARHVAIWRKVIQAQRNSFGKGEWEVGLRTAARGPMWLVLGEPQKRGGSWGRSGHGAQDYVRLCSLGDGMQLKALSRRAIQYDLGFKRITGCHCIECGIERQQKKQ